MLTCPSVSLSSRRYHHITVLLFCWHSYVTKSPPGVYFVGMNYAVHALMYFYYFLMAIHRKPQWLGAYWITLAQISQMIVGVAVTLAAFYYYKTEPACNVTAENNAAAFVMYGSYLALFVQFFVQRYFSGKSGSKAKSAATSGAKSRPKVPRRKED
jgi:elongation of very long chain fatty acids protein 6